MSEIVCSCCFHSTLTFTALLHRAQITTLKCTCLTLSWMWPRRLCEHWWPLWRHWQQRRLQLSQIIFLYTTFLLCGSMSCEVARSFSQEVTEPILIQFRIICVGYIYSLSQKMFQVLLAIALTCIHQFLQFLAHVISRHSKIGCRYNFLNYLAFT